MECSSSISQYFMVNDIVISMLYEIFPRNKDIDQISVKQ